MRHSKTVATALLEICTISWRLTSYSWSHCGAPISSSNCYMLWVHQCSQALTVANSVFVVTNDLLWWKPLHTNLGLRSVLSLGNLTPFGQTRLPRVTQNYLFPLLRALCSSCLLLNNWKYFNLPVSIGVKLKLNFFPVNGLCPFLSTYITGRPKLSILRETTSPCQSAENCFKVREVGRFFSASIIGKIKSSSQRTTF